VSHPTFIHRKEHVERQMMDLAKRIQAVFDFESGICEVTWRKRQDHRSLPQNAQFHALVADIAEHINSKGHSYTAGQMKKLLKYKFLGTESLTAWDGTVIPDQVKSTARLDTGEMRDLIDRVQDWALGIGVKIRNPADGEYMRRTRGMDE
jgi:hypothetical protein